MIKFAKKLPEGRHLVGLGISNANLARLKKDEPIVFPCKDVDIEGGLCLIVYDSADFRANESKLAEQAGISHIVVLSDAAIEELQKRSIIFHSEKTDFIVILGEPDEIMKEIQGKIGPQTSVRSIGMPPTDKSGFFSNN